MASGETRYALKIFATGKETYRPIEEVLDDTSFQYSGRRGNTPVFMQEKVAYWWNGHDKVQRDAYGCVVYVPMHRPGEVVS